MYIFITVCVEHYDYAFRSTLCIVYYFTHVHFDIFYPNPYWCKNCTVKVNHLCSSKYAAIRYMYM